MTKSLIGFHTFSRQGNHLHVFRHLYFHVFPGFAPVACFPSIDLGSFHFLSAPPPPSQRWQDSDPSKFWQHLWKKFPKGSFFGGSFDLTIRPPLCRNWPFLGGVQIKMERPLGFWLLGLFRLPQFKPSPPPPPAFVGHSGLQSNGGIFAGEFLPGVRAFVLSNSRQSDHHFL